ncbi:hypothetical protein LAZ67_23000125 [Cordylochernes scorpioides]|uniref:DUF5641 domain-containing protein n=1 Tax=Cordylochernes scorpioides TaxID=51811 RepID=A0ABY6LS78_9ARAC|nr:hypothetical protein LAZ67_23000125 [Cordylochernes scorpioides]
MEILKRHKSLLRKRLTRSLKTTEEFLLGTPPIPVEDIENNRKVLEETHSELLVIQGKIMDFMLTSDVSKEELEHDDVEAMEYTYRYKKIYKKCLALVKPKVAASSSTTSEVSFASSSHHRIKTSQDLRLSPIGQESVKHVVFGGHSESVNQEYRVTLGHASGNFKMVAKPLDQQNICGNLPRQSRGPWMKELKARRIWVPDIGKDDKEIEILLGCDVFGFIFMMKSCMMSNGLTESQTRFERTSMEECQPGSDVSLVHHVTTMTISESSINNLWNLDVLGIMDPIEVKQRDQRDALARRHFLKTVHHSVSGRYVVSFPWTVEKAKIADNREIAIRPVFDASSKVYRSPSLNDCLEKGPNLIEMIPNLMLRFRNGKFGVVADIEKAFLQIEVNERDRDYLRFLWYSQNGEKTEVFRHRRVVFGVNCSPFILGAVIEYHLSNVRPEQKPLAQRLQKSFYVDNLVTSVNSFEELQDLKLTATSIMENSRMELSRWEHSVDVASDTYPYERAEISKVLGIYWDNGKDCLSCEISVTIHPKIIKRSILSCLAQIYDPIGFLNPILIKPKIILQKVWIKRDDQYKDLNEEEICAERKKIAVVTTVKSTDHWYMKYFSSFIKNVRMMAWIRRSINNLRSSTKVKGELSVKEIDEAELVLLKLVQAECFPSHSMPGLKVYEVEGILRVKTKLIYSSDEYSFRLPALLHGIHPLIEQMICDSHVENCHAGVQFLMNKLREKYWIVKARQTIKKIVIRSVTSRRLLGTSTLTYQQLMTLLCHAEAVMNGRPMTYVSDDPNDLVTISPSMFLQEQTDVEFPECKNMGSNPTTQKLRYLSKLKEELKSRFRKEYLSLLVQRNRRIYNPKLQAGDVVLVGMDNKKRNFWPLAVIEEILFGRDGVNRLVKVKTAVGTFLRPIQKIYPLEISSTAASSRLLNDKEKTAKIQTRSGRTVCIPNRLDDYCCFPIVPRGKQPHHRGRVYWVTLVNYIRTPGIKLIKPRRPMWEDLTTIMTG